MHIRLFTSSLLAAALAWIPAVAAGQGPGGARATASAKTGKVWTPSRTPWGDPDLQGLWPAIDMQGTPYERPPELAGTTHVNHEEIAARQEQRRRQAELDTETVVIDRPRTNAGTGPP